MVIPMDAPTQAEMVWFGILMLILIGLTHRPDSSARAVREPQVVPQLSAGHLVMRVAGGFR